MPTKLVSFYQYISKSVLENQTHKIHFDRAMLTNKTVHNYRPGIILTDKNYEHTYSINIIVFNTYNLQKTIPDKINK